MKPDYFVIMDEIKSVQNSYWLLHTTAQNFSWNDQSVSCETPWCVNLDVFVLSPERPIDRTIREGAIGDWVDEKTVAIEPRNGEKIKPKGTESDFFPFRFQKYLAFSGKPNENFLIVLHPRHTNAPKLNIRKLDNFKIEVDCENRTDIIEFTATGINLNKGGKRINL